MLRQDLQDWLATLPQRPGVYLFRGDEGQVLYVGKAKNLRARVRSYFQRPAQMTGRILHLVNQVEHIETIVTGTEVEALVLEANLIKRHKPPYNIRLRDDKQYPYIKVTVNEPFPRVMITRSVQNDGARYFGPYTDPGAVKETLKVLRRAFPYRTCSNYRLAQEGRPCLYYYIGRCLGPCDNLTTAEEYDAMIEEMCQFLEGRSDGVLQRLEKRMHRAAEELDFEQAAQLRDQIRALRRVLERQQVISGRLEEQDVVALAMEGDQICAQVFFVREGRVVGRDHFMLQGGEGVEPGEALAAFMKQHYAGAAFIPREILVAVDLPPEEQEAITDWLTQLRGSRVFIRRPRRGDKRRLVELAAENARVMLEQEHQRQELDQQRTTGALAELADYLHLDVPPERIECYDISNFQGREAVGAMVVFHGGRAHKDHYRRFKIHTVEGSNDYAMLQEVLYRRFRRAQTMGVLPGGTAEGRPSGNAGDQGPLVMPTGADAFGTLPDLILVDGGKGQLSAALEVLRAFNLDHIPTFGLAEKQEHLFAPGRKEPIVLPADSPALHLLQRIRDEAHRFAVSYHRKLRSRGIRSLLDDIPGIGRKRRNALLKHFGSIDAIRAASVEELAAVPGMNMKVARTVKERL